MNYKEIYTHNYFSGKDCFFYRLGYGRFSRFYFNNLFRPLEPYVKKIKTGKVLDAGCAYGFMLKKFPDSFEKYGVDVSDCAIKEASRRLPGATFKVGNIEDKLFFPEESFDMAICNDVLEHLKNPAVALKNIRESLKKDGILYVTTPNLNWLRKKLLKYADKKEHHVSLFSHEAFLDLLSGSGFKVVDHWTYISLTSFFFPKFKSRPEIGIESAFICRKSSY